MTDILMNHFLVSNHPRVMNSVYLSIYMSKSVVTILNDVLMESV
jgi:hypothetical protein